LFTCTRKKTKAITCNDFLAPPHTWLGFPVPGKKREQQTAAIFFRLPGTKSQKGQNRPCHFFWRLESASPISFFLSFFFFFFFLPGAQAS